LAEPRPDRDIATPTPDPTGHRERADARRFGDELVEVERVATGDLPEPPRRRRFDLAVEHPVEQRAHVVRSEWLQIDAFGRAVPPEGRDRVLDRLARPDRDERADPVGR